MSAGVEIVLTRAELAEIRHLYETACKPKHPGVSWESFLAAYAVMRAEAECEGGAQ